MSTPSWKSALPSPPRGAVLREAWMTSYDRPDAALLVEHFLPSLLEMNRAPTQEPRARDVFFGELSTSLERLRGRLTIIASPPRTERTSNQYPWLWRYVDHFMVGVDRRAVQHAKLWAFHWSIGGADHLELYVSSTNLTASAFKGQLQAGWHRLIALGDTSSMVARRSSWGDLERFLKALGSAAGTKAAPRVKRLLRLLDRAECPNDVSFLASIPREKSAARKLARFDATEMHILTPTIGEWTASTLAAWVDDTRPPTSGKLPERRRRFDRIHLKWISSTHEWARGGWALTSAAHEQLQTHGVRIQAIPRAPALTEAHREVDARWAHAKLYLLRSRRRKYLLVTSANWSVSAWGAGKTKPRNFELGVVLDCDWSVLEEYDQPFSPPTTVPFLVDRAREDDLDSSLQWAEASWDGQHIELSVRSSDQTTPITASVTLSDGSDLDEVDVTASEASLGWTDATTTPVRARFMQGPWLLDVDVLDLRTPAAFAETPLPEVDPNLSEGLREAFLLQRYGGPMVEDDSIPGPMRNNMHHANFIPADYTIQAWLAARNGFKVLDRWRDDLANASAESCHRDSVQRDGAALRILYQRRADEAGETPLAVAMRLVAQELAWRHSGES